MGACVNARALRAHGHVYSCMFMCMCEYVCVACAVTIPGSGLTPLHTHCRTHTSYTRIQYSVSRGSGHTNLGSIIVLPVTIKLGYLSGPQFSHLWKEACGRSHVGLLRGLTAVTTSTARPGCSILCLASCQRGSRCRLPLWEQGGCTCADTPPSYLRSISPQQITEI